MMSVMGMRTQSWEVKSVGGRGLGGEGVPGWTGRGRDPGYRGGGCQLRGM